MKFRRILRKFLTWLAAAAFITVILCGETIAEYAAERIDLVGAVVLFFAFAVGLVRFVYTDC